MFSRQQKILLGILATVQFNNIVDFMIMMPMGQQLMRVFEITPHQFSLLVSCYTFFAAGSGLISSLFIDRFDRKRVLQFFFFGFSIGTIACGLSPKYEYLLFFRSLTGLFGGVLGSLAISIVSDTVPYEKRGTALGIVMTAFSFASIIGVPFSLFLANHFNWHAPFHFLGFFSLFVSFLISWGVPNLKAHMKLDKRHDPFAVFKMIYQNHQAKIGLLFMFSLIFGQFVLIPFLSPSLVSNAGMTEEQLPLIYITGGIVSIITGPAWGILADRYGKHKVFTVALLGSIIPMLLITHISNPTPIPIILGMCSLFFLFMGGRVNPAMALISASVDPTHRGSFMSVITCLQQLGSGLSSYSIGLIVLRDPAGHLLNYEYAGYIAAVFSFLALILCYKIKAISSGQVPIETIGDPH